MIGASISDGSFATPPRGGVLVIPTSPPVEDSAKSYLEEGVESMQPAMTHRRAAYAAVEQHLSQSSRRNEGAKQS